MISYRAGVVLLISIAFSTAAWAQKLVGSEFQVNAFTPGIQRFSSVSFAPSGDFALRTRSGFEAPPWETIRSLDCRD